MLSIFCAPSRYVQGRNATEALGSELAKLGYSGNVLVIAGRSARKLLEGTWERSLTESGFRCFIENFTGECSLSELKRLRELAEAKKANVIVGAGGGKVGSDYSEE